MPGEYIYNIVISKKHAKQMSIRKTVQNELFNHTVDDSRNAAQLRTPWFPSHTCQIWNKLLVFTIKAVKHLIASTWRFQSSKRIKLPLNHDSYSHSKMNYQCPFSIASGVHVTLIFVVQTCCRSDLNKMATTI
jgi:hypothetical protein